MNDSQIINRLENLKKLRESKNMTQRKLSMELDVSQELISRYEVGTSFPQPNMLIKLANYFNCSVDYLLGLTDITTPIKYIAQTNSLEYADILSKYEVLSKENKQHLSAFLNFLYENQSKQI